MAARSFERKFVKKVRKKIPWIAHIIDDTITASDLALSQVNF